MDKHKKEAEEYLNSNLFSILYEPHRYILVNALCSKTGKQGQFDFFDNSSAERLSILLQDILSYIRDKKHLYARWTQTTKGGKKRKLSVPQGSLKEFFENYLLDFIKSKNAHESCHGGEKGWFPKKSLETHLPCGSAFSFDIRNAFPNLTFEKVFAFFYNEFDNFEVSYEDRRDSAGILALLSTVKYEHGRGLAMGSSISMALFNRILYPLDETLLSKSKEREFRYSRWVDDITISSPEERDLRYFLGSLDLVEEELPIATNKVYFQESYNGNKAIYLLGHKIVDKNSIYKNTEEERMKNKPSPLNLDECFKNEDYVSW